MTTMLPYDMQLSNEHKFNKRFIDKYIREELAASEDVQKGITKGVELYEHWVNQGYYQSKNNRLRQLKLLDSRELVTEVIVHTCYFQRKELITSVCVQLANRLGFSEKKDGITTAAELLAVLCETDLFDLHKPEASDSIMLQSNIGFSDELMGYIAMCIYLPPMVCEPKEIKHNYQNGHLTFDDSIILKKYNHHDGDVCLDVINIQNKTAFSLDIEFLRLINEEPSSELDQIKENIWMTAAQRAEAIRQKKENWEIYYAQSQQVYMLMYQQGNRFHFTNKPDKRGRLYSQGYHINPQGSKYKKAMLNLADEEIVTGVPT